jgi:23S rRNA-/tRNA-specific pseudouridylate synthase
LRSLRLMAPLVQVSALPCPLGLCPWGLSIGALSLCNDTFRWRGKPADIPFPHGSDQEGRQAVPRERRNPASLAMPRGGSVLLDNGWIYEQHGRMDTIRRKPRRLSSICDRTNHCIHWLVPKRWNQADRASLQAFHLLQPGTVESFHGADADCWWTGSLAGRTSSLPKANALNSCPPQTLNRRWTQPTRLSTRTAVSSWCTSHHCCPYTPVAVSLPTPCGISLPMTSGTVHIATRLDRETSGLVLAAKDASTARYLQEQQGLGAIHKTYLALVHGSFPAGQIHACGWLVPDRQSIVRKKRRFIPAGNPWSPVDTDPGTAFNARQGADQDVAPEPQAENCGTLLRGCGTWSAPEGLLSLVEAKLLTGRTHQIRATLHSLGFPVVGDKLYGLDDGFFLRFMDDSLNPEDSTRLVLPYQALHCAGLDFHDSDGSQLAFSVMAPWSGMVKSS